MVVTAKLSVVAQAIVDLIKANNVLLDVGLEDVYYGDVEKVPRSRTITVEPVERPRDLAGAPMQVGNTFTVYIYVYVTGIESDHSLRKQCDELTEDIEDVLHSDKKLGGLLIQSWVTNFESGYAVRGGVLLKCDRITWVGTNKTMI
jgi:hypothetical protein